MSTFYCKNNVIDLYNVWGPMTCESKNEQLALNFQVWEDTHIKFVWKRSNNHFCRYKIQQICPAKWSQDVWIQLSQTSSKSHRQIRFVVGAWRSSKEATRYHCKFDEFERLSVDFMEYIQSLVHTTFMKWQSKGDIHLQAECQHASYFKQPTNINWLRRDYSDKSMYMDKLQEFNFPD